MAAILCTDGWMKVPGKKLRMCEISDESCVRRVCVPVCGACLAGQGWTETSDTLSRESQVLSPRSWR